MQARNRGMPNGSGKYMNSSNHISLAGERTGPSIKRLLILSILAYVLSFLVVINVTNFEDTFWVAWDIKLKDSDGVFKEANITNVHHTGDRIELTAGINITPEMLAAMRDTGPVGIMVSGPFSANIYWDGVLIGEKGIIGADGRAARPGKIDSISFLPSDKLTPGKHEIRLVMSTEHILYDAKRIVHLLALVPYRGDDRRALRYYAIPLLLMGGILLLMLQNIRIARSAGSVHHGILSLFAFFILMNLMTEVSRALINYSYDLHYYRGGLLWITATLAGWSLIPLAVRVKQTMGVRVIYLIGALLLAANWFYFGNSGDKQIVEDFMILSGVPTFVYGLRAFRNGINPTLSHELLLPLFWLAIFVCQRYSYGLFLDVYLFVAAMIFLSGSWYATYIAKPARTASADGGNQASKPAKATPVFTFKGTGKQAGQNYEVAMGDIAVMRAAENYTEMLDTNGNTHLHEKRLGALMEIAPDAFLRVHRSLGVNMAYAKDLKSLEGSRYQLILTNGERVPVSRYRVAEVRGVMA